MKRAMQHENVERYVVQKDCARPEMVCQARMVEVHEAGRARAKGGVRYGSVRRTRAMIQSSASCSVTSTTPLYEKEAMIAACSPIERQFDT